MKDLAEQELQALDGGSPFSFGSFLRGAACGAAMVAGAATGVGIMGAVIACSLLMYEDAY